MTSPNDTCSVLPDDVLSAMTIIAFATLPNGESVGKSDHWETIRDYLANRAERVVEGKLVGYVWPGKADYDYIHRCMGKDGDPEARRIPGGAVGVYVPLTAALQEKGNG